MSKVGLIARREIKARLSTKAFKVTTVLLALAGLAAILVPHFVSGGRKTYDVGVVGQMAASVNQALPANGALIDATIRVRTLPDEPAAEAALRHSDVDVVLVDGDRLIARRSPSPDLTFLISQVVVRARLQDRLGTAGLSASESAALLDTRPLPVRELDPESAAGRANKSLSFAGVLLIYLALLTYGSLVAGGVVEEKTSRVSEVLLGAVRPHQLMAGKVVGIGVAATTQLVCVGIPAAAAALSIGSLHVPRGTPLTFFAVLVWFVLAYGLYSCAYAAAGASASRPEEAGVVSGPLNVLVVVAYFVALAAQASPDSTVSKVVSFLPPFAPLTMLPRAANGTVAPWEVPLSMALVVATTWLLVRLAGRIYAGAIVASGPRVKLRDAWRQAGRRPW